MTIEEIRNKILSYQGTLYYTSCVECGTSIESNEVGRPIKYCKECSLKVLTIQKRESKKRLGRYVLGTTDIGCHFCGNFEKERDIIFREVRRLGLVSNQKIFDGFCTSPVSQK